ncbi:MAG: polyprenyl diphosphate synthase [Candidatus Saccharibacteria bacterium]
MGEPTDSVAVPQHLGIILDGNRRWAREHGLPVIEGHRRGVKTFKKIIKSATRHGVRYISAYVFSTENWQRDRDEVKHLMKLFMWVLKHEIKELNSEGIRLRVIGSKVKLGHALAAAIHDAEELTKDNDRGTVLLCLDYGGQQEIVDAVKRIAELDYNPEDITPELISKFLYAPDVPPIDMIIRTSGEQRISNFMLWESAYSEFLFDSVNWPDFDDEHLEAALNEYAKRQRRFGS